MTAREVGVQKEDKNRKFRVGWGVRNLEPGKNSQSI